jgi:hypothetical protein
MRLAEDFYLAVAALESQLPGHELLPQRLATACAQVLPVDGAGVSFTFPDRRLPLGASDDVSAEAERIEFTLGDGPCLTAQDLGLPLVADERTLQATWPAYHAALADRTPIRGVIAVPWSRQVRGVGVLELYLVPPTDPRSLTLADAFEVSREVMRALDDSSQRAFRSSEAPAWLDAPSVKTRAAVWQAMGFLSAALHIDGTDALALLRAHAYSRGENVDAIAARVIRCELPPAEFAFHAADD